MYKTDTKKQQRDLERKLLLSQFCKAIIKWGAIQKKIHEPYCTKLIQKCSKVI